MRWKFDFWVLKWLKCLILVGFDDMLYDKWFDELDFGFCLILLGILKIGERLDFLVGVWMNQLYGLQHFRFIFLVFATPLYHKPTVFLHFSVGLIIEQMFDKIRSGLLSRTNSNVCLYRFRLYHIVYYSFYLYKIIYNKIIKTC